jgi:hypothetical protein
VELRAVPDTVAIHALDGQLLAAHPRARHRGSWVVDPEHWAGLPDGHTRATTTGQAATDTTGTLIELPRRHDTAEGGGPACSIEAPQSHPLTALLEHRRDADVQVARRPLTDYAALERHPDSPAGAVR